MIKNKEEQEKVYNQQQRSCFVANDLLHTAIRDAKQFRKSFYIACANKIIINSMTDNKISSVEVKTLGKLLDKIIETYEGEISKE